MAYQVRCREYAVKSKLRKSKRLVRSISPDPQHDAEPPANEDECGPSSSTTDNSILDNETDNPSQIPKDAAIYINEDLCRGRALMSYKVYDQILKALQTKGTQLEYISISPKPSMR